MKTEIKNVKGRLTTRDITIVGVMAALVFAGTYFFKIPAPLTMGYTHLGDCMIFLTVYLFGWKRGALAGAIGGTLSDVLGGFVVWIVPTFFIKMLMAMVAGILFDKLVSKGKYFFLLTFTLGGMLQIVLYALTDVLYFGLPAALGGVWGLTVQSSCGVVIACVIIIYMEKSHITDRIKQMGIMGEMRG